jgi:hypothetical protein
MRKVSACDRELRSTDTVRLWMVSSRASGRAEVKSNRVFSPGSSRAFKNAF